MSLASGRGSVGVGVVVAPITEEYRAYGAAGKLFRLLQHGLQLRVAASETGQALEVVLDGPAGTGKSRACLELLNWLAMSYPGARILMVRKTRRSLTESGMVTLETKVLHPAQGVRWQATKQHYAYPNGSIIAVGGMDKPGKIMSSEWDAIYCQEATELDEPDWESGSSRLRNGVIPVQFMLGDCNPDSPQHWLLKRAQRGQVVMLASRHEDNPTVTPEYLARLDALTGVRYMRLRRGLWAAAEGMVYADCYDPQRNLVMRQRISSRADTLYGDCGIDPQWPRYLVVDFGYTHPFVAQWYAEDPDGRLWRYRELYMTHRLVEDHAKVIRQYARWGETHGDPLPRAIICDHDAEDRATLERHLGLRTVAAHKAVKSGLDATMARWRPAGDGLPRLLYLRDSLIERDAWLVDAKQPTCGEEEIESYVWDDAKTKEQPVKECDHAMDTTRYMVAARDLRPGGAKLGPRLF